MPPTLRTVVSLLDIFWFVLAQKTIKVTNATRVTHSHISGNRREVSAHPKLLVQIFTRRFRGNAWISVRDMAVTADPWDCVPRSGCQLIDVPAGALAERTAPIQRISRELVSRERR